MCQARSISKPGSSISVIVGRRVSRAANEATNLKGKVSHQRTNPVRDLNPY